MTHFRSQLVSFGLSLGLLLPQCTLVEHVASQKSAALRPLSRDECRTELIDQADLSTVPRAAEQSLEYYRRLPEDRALPLLDRTVSVRGLRSVIESLFAQPLKPGDVAALCDRFVLTKATPSQPLLVTGYYEPELEARRRRGGRFRYPLYALPDDLVEVELSTFCPTCGDKRGVGRVRDGQLVPYCSRAEIDAGAIDGHAAVIAWLDDPVEVFVLHLQGSALLHFDDGVHVHISVNGSNGRPYTSISRALVDAGKLSAEHVSLASLKDYLRAHADERDALVQRNERYIFFRTVPAGPVGSLAVPLTAGRSLAADAHIYPTGALVLLKTASEGGAAGLSRLAFVQDTGATITGDHRLDVFWGTGDTAAAIASGMRAPGELYFLLPR
ncbi:MAG: MltA domain-containing protein [Deltaproteobacteria bacterium]|nr:MltA domain-containing protein [Deltaproteobacteria bacterium]MBI3391121.1 MltA domain-containing protein [Deltaproteobacteria bacterium]